MNTDAINELVARWAEPDGIPYKGKLISDDGCMCAQGQALHYIGGWDEDRLRNAEQDEADRETAKLLGISTAHAILLRTINDGAEGAPSVVLTDPAKVLGAQADKVLAFWWHLDQMTEAQWDATWDAQGSAGAAAWAAHWDAQGSAWASARDAAWAAARDAAWDAAGDAAGAAARTAHWDAHWDAAWAAHWDAAWDAAGDAAWDAAGATNEIQGAAIMRERGQPFFFLPLFGFASPEDIGEVQS